MIKKNLTFFGLLALFAASCSNDELNEIPAIKQDAIVVTAGLNANTRVTFSQGDNVTHAFWEENDQITLYAASQGGLDYQVSSIGEGGNTATFAPVGDALRNTDEAIYATYPATVIKEGLATLPATDVWTDEKPLPFAYATSRVTDGSVNLSFDHLFAYLKLTLNAEATTDEVTSLWMKTSSSEPLTVKEGTYDIANDKLNLVESSNSIYFKLREPFIATDATEKSLYIPILPQPAGETITLSILHEHEAGCDTLLTIQKETPASGFLAGHAYTYSPKAPWETNKIVLSTAGTLSTMISETAKDTITKLKIIGPLNGSDIRLIREMAGRDKDGLTTEGKLTDLDISEAMIVEGGGYYYSQRETTSDVIGSQMFQSTNLKIISLPQSVTTISSYAFYGCHSLAQITIGDNVTNISNDVFHDCTSLNNVVIPNTVSSIGKWAFLGCTSLENVVIGEGITTITEETFRDCSALTNIVIPNNVDSIGRYAFSGCTSLTKLKIGNGVKNITNYAFSRCEKLEEIVLGNKVASIGSNNFINCVNLESIVLPESVTCISDGVFSGCTSLSKVVCNAVQPPIYYAYAFNSIDSNATLYIPSGTYGAYMDAGWSKLFKTITDGVFETNRLVTLSEVGMLSTYLSETDKKYILELKIIGSLNGDDIRFIREMAGYSENEGVVLGRLKKLDISEACIVEGGDAYHTSGGTSYYTANDVIGAYMFYNTNMNIIKLPETITAIEASAFSNCKVVDITIPESVVSIGNYAFEDSYFIREITIPNSVVSISKSTFENCTNLKSVVLPENLLKIGDSAFHGCTSLTDLVLPPNITTIDFSAFYNCKSLTSLDVPNSVVSIGSSSFMGCSALEEITLSQNLTKISSGVFTGCTELKEIIIPNKVVTIESSAFYNCSALTNVVFPPNLVEIGDEVYYNCSSLESVVLPNGVTSIGKRAFYGCTTLDEILLPSAMTYIGPGAFQACSSLNSIKIPTGITTIGDSMFSNCTSLANVELPETLTQLIQYSFNGCSALVNINLPNSITSIAHHSFCGCTSLIDIELPNDITIISKGLFLGCTSLKKIILPPSISQINNFAFENCSSLTEVTCKPITPPTLGDQVFYDTSNSATLYVPTGCSTAYSESDWASYFATIEEKEM